MKRITSLILLSALISALLPVAANAQNIWIPRRFRQRLPRVDKVELQRLKPSEYGFRGVEESKTFERADARRLASLWRAQSFHTRGAACHNPVFGIKFFYKEDLIMHASVCWDCNNILLVEPTNLPSQGFAGGSRMGRKLLEEFISAFPKTGRLLKSKDPPE